MCNNCAYAYLDIVILTVNESIVKKRAVASDLVQPEKFAVLSSSIVKQNEKRRFHSAKRASNWPLPSLKIILEREQWTNKNQEFIHCSNTVDKEQGGLPSS